MSRTRGWVRVCQLLTRRLRRTGSEQEEFTTCRGHASPGLPLGLFASLFISEHPEYLGFGLSA